MPQVLVLHLKRWQVTGRGANFREKKIDKHITFATTLDLSAPTPQRYLLRSVIVHSGQAGAGHYTSCIRTDDNDWFLCDDSCVPQRITEKQVLAVKAYMLFYERITA